MAKHSFLKVEQSAQVLNDYFDHQALNWSQVFN